MIEIDHVFVFVDPEGQAVQALAGLGLIETYRRNHQGQGTRNVCFCFDNLFLECIWVSDEERVRDAAVARTGLYERSRWREAGTCPFGIAWRGGAPGFRPVTWAYRPPYLAAGMAIAVSVDGDDPRQPMMFESPGGSPPLAWPAAKRGAMQRGGGLGRVLAVRLALPSYIDVSATLAALAEETLLVLDRADCGPTMTLSVERLAGGEPFSIGLPL